MQKIFSIITVFLSVCLQGFAQQFINLYQDNVVIKQYSTEEIDSMSVSETEPRIVSFWRDGDVFQTYNAADIDSIKVSNRGGAPLSYIGIVGFNSQLQTKDIGILSPSTASQYMSFVSNLPKRDGSILYYAVDNALDMLEDAHIESPLKSVNVITFTDGLDQGSLMMTDKYSSSAAYIDALDERIAQAKDSELSPNFIALGLRGSDVSDMSQFRQNLQRLASSADNVFEVSSISDLRAKFQDIANQIISVSTRQSMSVRVIGVETGTRMRFVFDGNSAATSELYIEGTFNLQDLSLHNVTYHGIKATSGKTVQGTQDGIFVTYTFTGMRLEAGTSLIPTSSVKHYYMYPSSTSWQANSEFTPTGNTQRNVSHSGTLIFLVLDCSSSLGSDFSRMQQYANEFIDLIASNAEPFEQLAPTNVKAEVDVKDEKFVVNVSWDAVKYAQSYDVYRSSSSNGTYELVAENISSTIWTDISALYGNSYYYIVRAKNWNEASPQSSYASVEVRLAAPTNVEAEIDENDLVVNVSWDAVKYAQSYDVYRSSSSSGTYSLVAEGITSTTWIDDSPLEGYNYYKVCAEGYGFTSSQSSYESVTVSLAAPTNVKAEIDENDLVVNVSWDAVKYAQSYNVYRSSSRYSGTYSLVAEGVTSTTWKDESPQEGDNYYKVCAVNRKITSSQSSYASVNVSLDAPTNVKAEIDENDLVVNVSWDAVKYAESYNVYRSSSFSGTYSLIAERVTSTSWTDNNPLNGNNYYKVNAQYKDIISDLSNAVPALDPTKVSIITVNGVAFNMVKVSGGTFQMGAKLSGDGNDDEQPVHQVTLSDYYIGETEVTQELWQAVMGSNPSYFTGSGLLPVEEVSWNDCQTFITKLNALTGMQFRLPTEAEWEFAARGGNSSQGYKYSGSNDIDDVAWYTNNSNSKTHEVGTKAPNELGLYDMSGNVREWCQDWYSIYSSSAQTNPTGPTTSDYYRVIRGGCWDSYARFCRVSGRSYNTPGFRYEDRGLRLAL